MALCYFVDLKNPFNTVPREKLWKHMEDLKVPNELRVAIHRLYDQDRARIKTKDGISEWFGNDIGVRHGCPLSPTLFGLYVDKLKDWMNKTLGGGVQLVKYMVKLLLYVDNFILIAQTTKDLREHLRILKVLHKEVGMQVNTSKTKIMIFSLKKKQQQADFHLEGNVLEIVVEYKYLGMDFNNKLN